MVADGNKRRETTGGVRSETRTARRIPPTLNTAAFRQTITDQAVEKWRQSRAKIDCLTRREHQVLVLVAKGASSSEVGQALCCSKRTVDIHLGNLLRKLEAKSLAEVIQIALYAGVDNDFTPFSFISDVLLG